MRELSMSAERWGMFDTQATVLSEAGVGGFKVFGDEPWKWNGNFSGSRSAWVNDLNCYYSRLAYSFRESELFLCILLLLNYTLHSFFRNLKT